MAAKDMLHLRFGLLTVVCRSNNSKDGSAMWECVCDCGAKRVIAGTSLRAGRYQSCGCVSPRFTSERLLTHGMSSTRTYRIWSGMRTRCGDGCAEKSRHKYVDKGVTVCDRWQVFENFLADMGEAPLGMSIDRIDSNGHYEPANCRWATAKQQANNMSVNHVVEFNGRALTVALWADELGIKPNTLLYRLRRGIATHRALQSSMQRIGKVRAAQRKRKCLTCGSEFIPRQSQLRQGAGKFCSRKCIA